MNTSMLSVTTVRSWRQMITLWRGQRDVSPEYDPRAIDTVLKHRLAGCRVTDSQSACADGLGVGVLQAGLGCSGN
jgi:hypothetical protein